uniref:Growth hormone secretagogue receptor type 1 n=1 Tax=Erpetoichthys calabaricus TaxID=27687 RepID=A0A8C4T107_ERPCA
AWIALPSFFMKIYLAGNGTDTQPQSLFEFRVLVPITAICLVLFLLGVLGNLTTIFVFQYCKEMRTTTNLYLSSMALSDILIFAGLPFDLYRLWRYRPFVFGDFLCRFQFYLSETCTYATILHITTLSMERYLAICFPLRAKRLVTKQRVKLVIVALWLISLMTAGPIFFLFKVDQQECKHTDQAVHSGLLQTMIWVSTVYFFLPLTCLTLLYGLISRKLWKSRQEIQEPNARNRARYHRQTIKMLVLVVLAFAVCWLPFHVGRILFSNAAWNGTDAKALYHTAQYFNLVSMVLFYLSASINPVLYNLMSGRYRCAVCRLLGIHRVPLGTGWSSRRSQTNTPINTEISTCV